MPCIIGRPASILVFILFYFLLVFQIPLEVSNNLVTKKEKKTPGVKKLGFCDLKNQLLGGWDFLNDRQKVRHPEKKN